MSVAEWVETCEPKTTFTLEEYLLLEQSAAAKSEYVDGRIYAMAGASLAHTAIQSNLDGLLRTALRGTPCRPYGSDAMVKAPSDRFFSYPDVTVACKPLQTYPGHRHVLMNPRAVFEVLSRSTEANDLRAKFERYREIASLQEYVLVSQPDEHGLWSGGSEEPWVEVRHRISEEEWESTVATGLESVIELPSLGVVLSLAEIFQDLPELE